MQALTCSSCGRAFEAFSAAYCSHTCYLRARKKADPTYRKDYHRDYKRKWSAANGGRERDRLRETIRIMRGTKPWHRMILSAKSRAKEKGLPFDLTDAWGAATWTGRCSLTGIEFDMWAKQGRKPGPHTFVATIDRIENSLGYTQGNCRFILWCVNAFKGCMTDAQMSAVAGCLVDRSDEKSKAA